MLIKKRVVASEELQVKRRGKKNELCAIRTTLQTVLSTFAIINLC